MGVMDAHGKNCHTKKCNKKFIQFYVVHKRKNIYYVPGPDQDFINYVQKLY